MRIQNSCTTLCRLGTLLVCALAAEDTALGQSQEAETLEQSSSRPHRVVHQFDFDERPENLESLPKYWQSFGDTDTDAARVPGFPRFAEGAFDFGVGREAPPSFHLASQGRNVAYQYRGPDTRVQPGSIYHVEGFVRADRLDTARTCISALFLDERQNPLNESLVRTPYIGGDDAGEAWVRFDLYLPPAPPAAHTISLIAWVLQSDTWDLSLRPRRHIDSADVTAGAWYDDITIHVLPQIAITTSAPGNVLSPDKPQEIRVVLGDFDDKTLSGRLAILSADGSTLSTHPVPVTIGRRIKPHAISVSHLDPGLYVAELKVFSARTPIDTRRLRFAKLGKPHRAAKSLAQPFGLVISPIGRSDATTELHLLKNQLARSAKFSLWTGGADEEPNAKERRSRDRLLQNLIKDGFALTGVFAGPPRRLVESAGAYVRPLVEIVSDEPQAWRDDLAAVVAPHANTFRWWQLGADGDPAVYQDPRLVSALDQLRAEMIPLITQPYLVAPASAEIVPPDERWPVEQLALAVSSESHPFSLRNQVRLHRGAGYGHLSVYVKPLPPDRYRRLPRLADFAQRLLLARHGGADTVFVPQTWTVRSTEEGPITEPTEEYLILRTVSDMIGDGSPAGSLHLAPGVEALAFHHDSTTVLAMWDPSAPPGGAEYPIQLGQATYQVDLWGSATTLKRDEMGRQIVRLSRTPVFVENIERWLIELRASVKLDPPRVDFGDQSVPYAVQLANQADHPVGGTVRLVADESWEVEPNTFNLSLPAGGTQTRRINLSYPPAETAGRKAILTRITLDQSGYFLEIPLFFELGLKDVDVKGVAITEGDDLVLRQIVTNRSNETLHFRGSANVPLRSRQYHPFINLRPGETAVAEYRFGGAAAFSGQKVRLMLRELNDGLRFHNLVLEIP